MSFQDGMANCIGINDHNDQILTVQNLGCLHYERSDYVMIYPDD